MVRAVCWKYLTPLLLFLLLALSFKQSAAAMNGDHAVVSPVPGADLENGGYAVMKHGRVIAARNLHEMFVPASILKVATSLAALRTLGPGYRFETRFYIDTDQNLYIKGFGDPFLISEEVAVIVKELKKQGCRRINTIILDDSAFDISESADGAGLSDNPYDARNSALAVNFNTVNIRKEESGNTYSAEDQTPSLPLMAELAEESGPGIYRINISRDDAGGSKMISRYTGELFMAFLQKEGIPGRGTVVSGTAPDNLSPVYTHLSSRTLEDIIGPLMLYSNNYIANQLFLTVGAKVYGFPATWEKGRKAVAKILLADLKLDSSEIKVFEGSGLSRRNLVSPYAFIQLLELFKPYSSLLPQEDGRLLKTGTLKGVYSYGGYFLGDSGPDPYVLILNQEKNTRKKLLKQLELFYRQTD